MLKIQNIDSVCSGCCACHNICPHSAIKVVERNGGFYYPEVDEEKCVGCGLCEKTCPAISLENTAAVSKAYMFKAADEDVVYDSSSGGMFSVLADWIMNNGGVVYGARYDYQNRRLVHSSTDECDLKELRKSKYIESFIGGTYRGVRRNLQDDRYVLFVGTPCQVAGLYKYLGRMSSSEKLLTVDFVCHGVPSNQLFSDYVRYAEKKHKSVLAHFDFRPKERGWKGRIFKLEFSNGKSLFEPVRENYYYFAFNKKWMLRESCYNCTMLKKSLSDMTIGDFWGIRNIEQYKDEDKGMSMVVIHTSKGQEAFSKIAEGNFIRNLSMNDIAYVYGERETATGYDLELRKRLMEEVSGRGYMEVLKEHYWDEMLRERLHTFISARVKAVLRFMGLWKRK